MGAEMRVLTVRQPWAWAIINAGKDVENRTRNIAGTYRGPIAIHAGVAPFEQHNMASRRHSAISRDRLQHIDTVLWYGAIIGVVDLEDVHHFDDDLDSDTAATCSRWADEDVFHLVLRNARALPKPIAFKGALGLRQLEPTITAQVEQQLALAGGKEQR